jgi:hypothetical protein
VTKDKPFPQIKDRYDQKTPDTIFEVGPLRASELNKDIYLINHNLIARLTELETIYTSDSVQVADHDQAERHQTELVRGKEARQYDGRYERHPFAQTENQVVPGRPFYRGRYKYAIVIHDCLPGAMDNTKNLSAPLSIRFLRYLEC